MEGSSCGRGMTPYRADAFAVRFPPSKEKANREACGKLTGGKRVARERFAGGEPL